VIAASVGPAFQHDLVAVLLGPELTAGVGATTVRVGGNEFGAGLLGHARGRVEIRGQRREASVDNATTCKIQNPKSPGRFCRKRIFEKVGAGTPE
jgi:hypothetical protein